MDTPLIKEFTYHVPPEKVWQALTEQHKMKQWYFPQLQRFEPIVGYRFQFNDNDAEFQKEWTVTQVENGRRLAHSWAYKGYTGSSEVIFDVLPQGDDTKLKITQTNLDSFPDDPHFRRERFERGWDNLLGQNLRHLLEA